MKKITYLLLFYSVFMFSQSSDEEMLKAIYKSALTQSQSFY